MTRSRPSRDHRFSSVYLAARCSLGVVLSHLVRTTRQWQVVNELLALLLLASIVPIWL